MFRVIGCNEAVYEMMSIWRDSIRRLIPFGKFAVVGAFNALALKDFFDSPAAAHEAAVRAFGANHVAA